MGSGKQKAHEAIALAPAPLADPDSGAASTPSSWAAAEPDSVTIHSGSAISEGLAANPNSLTDIDGEPDSLGEAGFVDHQTSEIEFDLGQPAADSQALTPIPTVVAAGDMAGHPLIVGGDDLEDASLTLVAYSDTDGGESREVLYGWVTPEAEAKVLDAIALDDEKLVAVEVTKEVNGRLPLDEQHQLYEQLETVAKSVNHHLKKGDGIPQHTHDNLDALHDTLTGLHATVTADEQAMIAGYLGNIEQIAPKMTPGFDEPYATAKIHHIDPWTVAQTVTVTEMVPAPAEDVPDGLLPAAIRDTTRIKPTLDGDGNGAWDGTTRYTSQGGKEYRVDLGDGYEAVYRPHNAGDKSTAEAGQRGFLEIVAPPGSGHGPEMVERLGQLNLVNRPMTAAEAEWTYLQRNIWAQRLDQVPAVASTVAAARTLDDTVAELVFSERAHQAIGMNDRELARFAKGIQLEAEARALPEKTRMVRDVVAAHLGYQSGTALAESVGYNPIPRRTAGWYTWDRFDVAANPASTTAAFGDKVLYHRVTGNNVADIFANSAALVATERRRVMGIKPGIGASEGADMTSGGSRVVDLRVGAAPGTGPVMIWKNPTKLLRRADWYAYDGDHYAASVDTGKWSTKGQTRNPATVAGFKKINNEILFRNGIDLTGSEAPDQIKCSSAIQRSEVLAVLASKGISQLGGQPVDKVVTT